MEPGEGRFPHDILERIKTYSGNHRCCDCGSYDTNWASVSYGILICLRCSGKHRSLGVRYSFVRSIEFDSWTPKQVKAMELGGNYQMQEFFRRKRIENSDISAKYRSEYAERYRETLAEAVDKGLKLGQPQPPPQSPQHDTHQSSGSGHHRRRSSTESDDSRLARARQHHGGRLGTSLEDASTLYEVVVEGEEAIGVSIQKEVKTGRAKVIRVASSGPGARAGVKAGDDLAGVNGRVLDDYDDVMALLPNVTRPFRLVFRRHGHSARVSKPSADASPRVRRRRWSNNADTTRMHGGQHPSTAHGSTYSPTRSWHARHVASPSTGDQERCRGPHGYRTAARSRSGSREAHDADEPPDAAHHVNGDRHDYASDPSGDEHACHHRGAFGSHDRLRTTSWTSMSSLASADQELYDSSPHVTAGSREQDAPAAADGVASGASGGGEGGAHAATTDERPSSSPEEDVQEADPPPAEPPEEASSAAEHAGEAVAEVEEVHDGGPQDESHADTDIHVEGGGPTGVEVCSRADNEAHPKSRLRSPRMIRSRTSSETSISDDMHHSEPRHAAGEMDRLRRGDKVYVREEDGIRWRAAMFVRYHRTKSPASERHLMKVHYRDGTLEEYVDPDDVRLSRPTERRKQSHCSISSPVKDHRFPPQHRSPTGRRDCRHASHDCPRSEGTTRQHRRTSSASLTDTPPRDMAKELVVKYDQLAAEAVKLASPTKQPPQHWHDQHGDKQVHSPSRDTCCHNHCSDDRGVIEDPPARQSPSRASPTCASPMGKSLSERPHAMRDYVVVFRPGAMGLQLTKQADGRAVVTKVAPAGQAVVGGVHVGDTVISLNGMPLTLYDQVMAKLPHLPRPLAVGFRRKMEGVGNPAMEENEDSQQAPVASAKSFAGGFGKSMQVLKGASTAGRGSPIHGAAYPLPVSSHFGGNMTTKKALGPISRHDEFEVEFEDEALGLRLEEKAMLTDSGVKYVSEVTMITEDGAADKQGVDEGCVVIGINGERFISHAHAVATLKHGRRPITVRFRYPTEG